MVGAGLAGLTTAYRLRQRGIKVVVLEAKERVGGRTVNLPIGNGQITEGGGQWVGPTQDRVLALADELGIARFKTHVRGVNVLHFEGRRETYSGDIPPLAPHVLADFLQAQTRLDSMALEVPLQRPWEADSANSWDSQTLQTWLDTNVLTPQARFLFHIIFGITTGTPPRNVSLLHTLHFIHGAGGITPLISVTGGAQDSRFVGGSQQLALELARRLGARAVHLRTPVTAVTPARTGVIVKSPRGEIRADRVVISARPDDCLRIAHPRTTERTMLEKNWQAGTGWKAFAIYDEPFWRSDGLSGNAVTDMPGALTIYDNSPPAGRPGVLMTFLANYLDAVPGGHPHTTLNSEPARRDAMLSVLTACFGERASRPASYIERNWSDEPWIAGCESPRQPGLITQFHDAERTPNGHIHYAGTDTADVWSGYMDGAVRSGERAADEVAQQL